MFLRRRFAGLAAVAAALALAVPVASAGASTGAPVEPWPGSPHCPESYTGPLNLATGCPWWMMVP
ncbi:hypothetical protein [Candidatus Solirubrobacter pratensis]|jgi:hypothetical protein|uniref:hypothetical protein n=1 Tax=Candidatus Solirubrobacter pratensis TaxID=1298857 RepID=UPI0004215D76|nr:hypothetical protein [Candidatus Solirubrobacter pratensis]